MPGCPAAKIIFPIKAKAAKYTGTPDRRITPAGRLDPLPIRVSYAITLSSLRADRAAHQREQAKAAGLLPDIDSDTTLVLNH